MVSVVHPNSCAFWKAQKSFRDHEKLKKPQVSADKLSFDLIMRWVALLHCWTFSEFFHTEKKDTFWEELRPQI